MPYQTVNFTIKECWIACTTFDKFQHDILQLQSLETGAITLNNLRGEPIISFIKSGAALVTEILSKDSLGIGSLILKSTSQALELSEILTRLQQLDKWW